MAQLLEMYNLVVGKPKPVETPEMPERDEMIHETDEQDEMGDEFDTASKMAMKVAAQSVESSVASKVRNACCHIRLCVARDDVSCRFALSARLARSELCNVRIE